MASWITDDKPSSGSATGLVADAINDGTTTVAPSQNAVFDALALKAPLASPGLTGVPTAPTATPGTNTTQLATTAFVIASSGSARSTATYTTSSLALNASDNAGSITLAKAFAALQIQTTRAARVRLYATAAQRTADLSRPIGTDPTGDHGLLMEFVTGTDLDWAITPPAVGMSLETSPSSSIPIAVTNLDTTGTVGVTLTYIATEA